MEQAWIDIKRIEQQDYSELDFGDDELMSAEEQAEFERRLDEEARADYAYREAMEREQAEANFTF
jgi:hypothetical protein